MKFDYKLELNKKTQLMKSQINIIELARSIGLTITSVGNYYSTMEHPSIRFYLDTNTYFRWSRSKSGDVFDLLKEFGNMTSKEAYHYLDSLLLDTVTKIKNSKPKSHKKNFELPIPEKIGDLLWRNDIIQYLTKQRKIDIVIVNDFIKKKMIYQERKTKNIIFLGLDNVSLPVWGCKRSIMGDFKGDIPGSNYNIGFFINNSASTTVVTESVINLMSFMTLLKHSGININKYNYLSTGSAAKYKTILSNQVEHKTSNYIIYFDKDEAGMFGIINILNLINEDINIYVGITHTNDLNLDLINSKKLISPKLVNPEKFKNINNKINYIKKLCENRNDKDILR